MPELPEVEIMVRNLRSWLGGKRLARLDVIDGSWLRTGSKEEAEGLVVQSVWRRAKYAVLQLGGEDASRLLVLHYRMTGKTVRLGGGRRHIRALLVPESGEAVGFDDARRLGQAWLLRKEDAETFWTERRLGPEAWPVERDGRWWMEQLGGIRGQLKPSLMRQEKVAGIGNILATEICHRAGLAPDTKACLLSIEEWGAVAEACRQAIENVLLKESGDEIHFLAQKQSAPSPFLAYGRADMPCLRCGSASIKESRQSGRSTFHCPSCQPS
jgi:formamidopyrimidine-DNA glycosylase